MLYGFTDSAETLTIVGSANSLAEFETFCLAATQDEGLFVEWKQPSELEMLVHPQYGDFSLPPYVFQHTDTEQQNAFVAHFGISLVPPHYVKDRLEAMTAPVDTAFDDKRTLAEIYGLDKHDPWDKRSDEQKEKDAKYKALAEAHKKAGDLTGDSFSGKKNKDLQIRRTDLSVDKDGNVQVDGILAVKGDFFDDNLKMDKNTPVADAAEGEVFFRLMAIDTTNDLPEWLHTLDISPDLVVRIGENFADVRGEQNAHLLALMTGCAITTVSASGDFIGDLAASVEASQVIAPNGIVAIYQRLDIERSDLHSVLTALDDTRAIVKRGQTSDTVWMVFMSQMIAEHVVAKLKALPGYENTEMEIYGVSDNGVRLVPKGVEIVDETVRDDHPRIWNERAAELVGITEERLKENRKSLSGEYFLFTGAYHGAVGGAIIHITPIAYFEEHEKMFDQPLNIAHLLPPDLKEIEPGIYQSRSRDYEHIAFALGQAGFRESLYFQMYLNNL